METSAAQSRQERKLRSFLSTSCTEPHAEVLILLNKFYIVVRHYFYAEHVLLYKMETIKDIICGLFMRLLHCSNCSEGISLCF